MKNPFKDDDWILFAISILITILVIYFIFNPIILTSQVIIGLCILVLMWAFTIGFHISGVGLKNFIIEFGSIFEGKGSIVVFLTLAFSIVAMWKETNGGIIDTNLMVIILTGVGIIGGVNVTAMVKNKNISDLTNNVVDMMKNPDSFSINKSDNKSNQD